MLQKIIRVPEVPVFAETEVVAHLSHSSPAPQLLHSSLFLILPWPQAPLSTSAFFLIFVYSRACWVGFITTSTSLYCYTELYSRIRLCKREIRCFVGYQFVCVVFSSHSFWTSSSLDVPAGVTQEAGHTGFLIHLLSAVPALIFLARRIQSFLSLVDREVEFCVLTI